MISAAVGRPGKKKLILGSLRWSNWYLIALKLAMGVLLVLLIVLYFLLRQNEADEQRSTLIADVLWLEQSISFHLERNAEHLEQLAGDLSQERNKKALFQLRTQYLLKSNPDIQKIVWLDSAGRRLIHGTDRDSLRLGLGSGTGVIPGSVPGDESSAVSAPDEISRLTIEMVGKLGKTLYADAYTGEAGARFNVYTPVFEKGRFVGVLVGVYSFDSLLKQLVPWWFAEKYQVRVLDSNGYTLGGKSKHGELITPVNYSIPLEPPGFGMVLRVDAYPDKGDLAQRVLIGLVIALVAAVLASLWGMRKHIRRRIAAEQALRAEHAFRKAMEDSLTIGMRARDLDGCITYVNPAFCQMVGFSEKELLGTLPPLPFWPPEEMERIQAVNDALVMGDDRREGLEIRYMRKDGTRFDVLIYEAPLIDADGRQTGWMSSVVDVTERKRSEELARQQQEKMQQTSRLVTMGEMASSLAHELNQPLAAITSYNTGCLNRLSAEEFSREELRAVMEKLGVQARRAGHIIRRVHDFVRKSEPKLAPCNLVEIIEDSIGFIEADAKLHDVRIVRKIPAIAITLYADRVMLEQVLLNLMRNAIDAMSDDIPPERRRLTVRLAVIDDQARIRVADRGAGISPSIREKLFTPFFTTKQDGMGMGLNICRSIIEFHRGRLWVEDNLKGGTIFSISLPVAPPMTPTVHIVDDDEAIRDSLGWLLQSRGIPCLEFASAEAFVERWNPQMVGCILLDIRMGGMSGTALFDLLRGRGCTMPVIFLTGHGDVPLAVSALKHGAFDFVEKPCNDNQLVNRVVEALKLGESLRQAAASVESINNRLSQLSSRERQVMERVLAGKLNKVIADELHVSMRTVEVHRSSLFEKMGVKTAVELAQVLANNVAKP